MCDITHLIAKAIADGNFDFERYTEGGSYFGEDIKTMPIKDDDGTFGYKVLVKGLPMIRCNFGKREMRIQSSLNYASRLGDYK